MLSFGILCEKSGDYNKFLLKVLQICLFLAIMHDFNLSLRREQMELKLAKNTLNTKNKTNAVKISCEDILKKLTQGENIFYFDKENSHKDMQKACAFFQKAGHSTYLNEVRYALDEGSYIYELHIL